MYDEEDLLQIIKEQQELIAQLQADLKLALKAYRDALSAV